MSLNTSPAQTFYTTINIGDTSWDKRDELRALIDAAVPPVGVPLGGFRGESVSPEDIRVGDLLAVHGFIGKVVAVRASNLREKACYEFALSYVRGNLGMFRWFLGSICNGCLTGDLASVQGNSLRRFYRVS